MISSLDTIIAIATAPQNGPVGVIKISGPGAYGILTRAFVKPGGRPFETFNPRYFYFGHLIDKTGMLLDECLAVFMSCPNSFTGEDVVEFHCHGNLILLRRILRSLLDFSDDLNLRAAEPGEFSKRAFFHGKLDLTQVESIHRLITAESESAVQASLANLDGALFTLVEQMRQGLISALALVEASFEFSEEDIQTYDPSSVVKLISEVHTCLLNLERVFFTSKIYDHGVSVAIVGRPNVGKSSLFNALLIEERAIVTAIAGTTRDVIEGTRIIEGVRFIFRDTAGVREASDIIEAAGLERTLTWVEKSDIILYVSDDPLESNSDFLGQLSGKFVIRVLNKIDSLWGHIDLDSLGSHHDLFTAYPHDVFISVKKRYGIDKIEKTISDFVKERFSVQNNLHVNERQYKKITEANKIIDRVLSLNVHQDLGTEILAEELRSVILSLGEITGEVSNDDVLSEIFQRFCIGK